MLTPRIYREYKSLAELHANAMKNQRVLYKKFSEEEQREIVFKDITTGEVTHTTILDTAGVADYRSVIGYFAQTIMKELRLVSGYDVLFGKIKAFVRDGLFDQVVDLEHPNTLRNLSELVASKTLIETFKKSINALTVRDKGDAEIRDTIKLRETRPFMVKDQGYLIPKKSVFNRVIGDSHLELEFASFLEECPDVVSYAKNYFAVRFKLDYVNADGNISNYYPDFLVKLNDERIVIVETKGLEDLDVPLKWERLKQWCQDVNVLQSRNVFAPIFVSQKNWEKYKPRSFANAIDLFLDGPALTGEPNYQAPTSNDNFREHAMVRITKELTTGMHVIAKGTTGAIVDVYEDGSAYEVEFEIEPALVVTVPASHLESADE